MALFRLTRMVEPEPRLRGDGLYMRPPSPADYVGWAELREASRAFLSPWEPTWPDDDLTRAAYRRRMRRQADESARDESYTFFIFDAGTEALIGGLTLGGIRRGVSQTATLGYWMGARYAGRGFMTRSVGVVGRWAFQSLRLHRLEAACLPHNEPSKSVLAKAGFHEEGLARQYLRINGQWADHLLFALLRADYDIILRAAR